MASRVTYPIAEDTYTAAHFDASGILTPSASLETAFERTALTRWSVSMGAGTSNAAYVVIEARHGETWSPVASIAPGGSPVSFSTLPFSRIRMRAVGFQDPATAGTDDLRIYVRMIARGL